MNLAAAATPRPPYKLRDTCWDRGDPGLGVVWGEGHTPCGVANSKLALVLLLFIAVQGAPHKESAPYDGIFDKKLL